MAFAEQPYGELVDTTLRLVTWNTWGRFGPWEAREAALVETLRQQAPDVVALQECWVDDRGEDQAARLAGRLGLGHHVTGGGELLFGDWGLANGLVSRWPLVDPVAHPLPALEPGGWGGLALGATVDGPRGPVAVYCVALDWPPGASAARLHALRHLAACVDADQAERRAPLLVAGDLNAVPDSDELRLLTGRTAPARPGFVLVDAWEAAHPPDDPAGHTWCRANPWAAPALTPDRRIDYVLAGRPRRGGRGHVVGAHLAGAEPVGGVVASDHYAVVADVRY